VAKINKALDEMRAGESRRKATEGGEPVLKKSALAAAQTRRESED
jgi:hypothetical protein